MAEMDPEKVILEWCGHLSVPRWVDEKSYNNCKSCSVKMDGFLSKKDKHHCRLCGQMFCSACTQKYHLPLIFRGKNKDGPARVCMSCVDGCLAEKEKASAPEVNSLAVSKLGQSALSSSHVGANLQSMVKVVEIAPPSSWEDESTFVACPKCLAKKCKTHNCRVCGKLLCDKCTSKMDIPACFERKKGKTGPSRVCDVCRYKVVNGAKLVERLSGAAGLAASKIPFTRGPPVLPAAGAASSTSSSSSLTTPGAPGVAGAPGTLSPAGMAAANSGVLGSPFHSSSHEVVHAVVQKEGDGSIVAKIAIPGWDTPLSTIDTLLKKTAPMGEAYSYVFRGAPIPDAFFHVFYARHLGNTILIRPKRKHDLVSLEEEDMDGDEEHSGVNTSNNPFKHNAELEAKRTGGRTARPPKVEAKPVAPVSVFKKPVTKQVIAFDVTKTAATSIGGGPKKKGPQPLGAAAGVTGTGDELFKRRAKAYFGPKELQ